MTEYFDKAEEDVLIEKVLEEKSLELIPVDNRPEAASRFDAEVEPVPENVLDDRSNEEFMVLVGDGSVLEEGIKELPSIIDDELVITCGNSPECRDRDTELVLQLEEDKLGEMIDRVPELTFLLMPVVIVDESSPVVYTVPVLEGLRRNEDNCEELLIEETEEDILVSS